MAPAPAPLRLLSPAAAEETDGAGARRLGSEPGESADPARPVRHPRGTPSGAAGELRALGPGGARAPGAHRCGGLRSCAPRPGRRPPAPGASASRSESLGPGEDRCRIRERWKGLERLLGRGAERISQDRLPPAEWRGRGITSQSTCQKPQLAVAWGHCQPLEVTDFEAEGCSAARFLEIICMENHVFSVLSALGVDEDLLCFLCVYLVRAPGWLLPLITLS
ncbi:uncharacterized protein LOC116738300 [Lynx canadensis]|uniref:uncharacterized protein LOC116738300 n=1 Tax=Lynx canadensis TaxID=61383 RepID=UPI0013C480B2|nr:uncharacterized protein LOC116738300 [Lynx canadensis]